MKQKDDWENFLEHVKENQNHRQLYKPQGAAGINFSHKEAPMLMLPKENNAMRKIYLRLFVLLCSFN